MHWLKWLYPGMKLKRWIGLLFIAILFIVVGIITIVRIYWQGFLEDTFILINKILASDDRVLITVLGLVVVTAGFVGVSFALRGMAKSFITLFWADSDQKLVDLMFTKRRLNKGPNVTVIGGGTGLSTLLRCIKQMTSNCTAVVATTDNGGSSGRLREELGIIPPGDLRDCITALADTEPLMEKLMQYRFKEGSSLSGHSFGNLFITAMADIVGNMEKGLNATSKVLKVRGSVTPSTLESVDLVATMSDGQVLEGETNITSAGKKIEQLALIPSNPSATKSAIAAIKRADMLVLGPGSLYTSVITNLLIPEIREAVLASNAVKVYVCNVMTQPGETDGYSACNHVEAIYQHVGKDFFDYVVINKEEVSEELLEKYAQRGSYPVKHHSQLSCMGVNVVEANLISEENLVRHDPVKLAKTLIGLMYRLKLPRGSFKIFDYYFVRDSFRRVRKVIEGE